MKRFGFLLIALALGACSDPCNVGAPPLCPEGIVVQLGVELAPPFEVEACVDGECRAGRVEGDGVGCVVTTGESAYAFSICVEGRADAGVGRIVTLRTPLATSYRGPPSSTWTVTLRDGDGVVRGSASDVVYVETYMHCALTCGLGRAKLGTLGR